MNGKHLPPGQRLFRLSGEVAPGDVLLERGPRIGERYWGVVFVEKAKKWWHVVVTQMNDPEVEVTLRMPGVQSWVLT